MKASNRKKKKRGNRKSNLSVTEPKPVLKEDSSNLVKGKEGRRKNPPLVSRKASEKKADNPNKIVEYTNIAIQFLKDARTELRKVKWPTRKELIASTVVVIVLVLILAVFLGLIDFVLIRILRGIVG